MSPYLSLFFRCYVGWLVPVLCGVFGNCKYFLKNYTWWPSVRRRNMMVSANCMRVGGRGRGEESMGWGRYKFSATNSLKVGRPSYNTGTDDWMCCKWWGWRVALGCDRKLLVLLLLLLLLFIWLSFLLLLLLLLLLL